MRANRIDRCSLPVTRNGSGRSHLRGMKKLYVAVLFALFTYSFISPASAQDTTGTIAGRVADSQGLALPGVTVASPLGGMYAFFRIAGYLRSHPRLSTPRNP